MAPVPGCIGVVASDATRFSMLGDLFQCDPDIRLAGSEIYLDAQESVIERWFTGRLVPLMEAGAGDSKSFYYAFRTMGPEERRAFASRVWQGINLPNLRDHIVKDRDAADLILHKSADHRVAKVTELSR